MSSTSRAPNGQLDQEPRLTLIGSTAYVTDSNLVALSATVTRQFLGIFKVGL